MQSNKKQLVLEGNGEQLWNLKLFILFNILLYNQRGNVGGMGVRNLTGTVW